MYVIVEENRSDDKINWKINKLLSSQFINYNENEILSNVDNF